jgi:hypothetical protein
MAGRPVFGDGGIGEHGLNPGGFPDVFDTPYARARVRARTADWLR